MSKPFDISDFISGQILRMERNVFFMRLAPTLLGYIGVTLWLNAVRKTAPIALVWVLIILNILIYCAVYMILERRAKQISFPVWLVFLLGVVGFVTPWRQWIMGIMVGVLVLLSCLTRNLSPEGEALLYASMQAGEPAPPTEGEVWPPPPAAP